MIKFEIVSKYKHAGLGLPVRKTECSAGYDFATAEDVILEPYAHLSQILANQAEFQPLFLEDFIKMTKNTGAKPTLVSTGIKCQLPKDYYLELTMRSSVPLKSWIIMANSIGVIDSDYYNNESNEGEIFFQLINLSPYPIIIPKGTYIGQGIIKKYYTTDDDNAIGERIGGFGSTNK